MRKYPIGKDTHHPLYQNYYAMMRRCYKKSHPDYKHWGAKGIIVCFHWKDNYINFFDWAINNGWKEKYSLDRIDPTKNYTPENCKWVTKSDQSRSTKKAILGKSNEIPVSVLKKQGLSNKEISNKLEITEVLVRCIITRLKIGKIYLKPEETKKLDIEIEKLKKLGKNQKEISQLLNIPLYTVKDASKRCKKRLLKEKRL
jgi:hypothetical protein